MPDPRALVVDFGGVLTTSLAEAFRAFCEREEIDPERLRDLMVETYARMGEDSDIALVETGQIPTEEFERRLARWMSQGVGRPVEPEGLIARMLGELKPDPAMVEAVRRVREAGFKVGMLSNSWDTAHYSDELRNGMFDAVVISGEVGLRKPDPEIYRLAAERLEVAVEECVFVDDHPANVDAAERVGMTALLHAEAAETIPRLEEAFGIRIAA